MKFKLLKKDVYDLASVVANVVADNSDKLDFKEVLHLQKLANYLFSLIPDFSAKIDKLIAEKGVYVKNANEKIAAYKKTLSKETEESGTVDENYKERLDGYIQTTLEQVQADIVKEIQPEWDELYLTIGADSVEVDIDKEKYDYLVINFELYAKEKYTNKNKMVEVYEAITTATE